jgi:hypothetical protein
MARPGEDPAGGAEGLAVVGGLPAVEGLAVAGGLPAAVEGEALAGACLLDLRILPAFAPCYVATPRALVLGWNPASLARALRGGPESAGEAPSRLWLRLDRIAEADQRLRAARGEPAASVERSYGWERLEVAPGDGGAELRIALEAATSAPSERAR